MRRLKSFLFGFLSFFISGFCQQNAAHDYLESPHPAHQFYLGPEVAYVGRKKEEGTFQNGITYGGRFGYDYIKRSTFYVGIEGNYSIGHLNGKVGNSHLHSHYTDANIEGRLGYTFAQKKGYRFIFTPFFGGGYGIEKNHFTHSSPIPVHFCIRYQYACLGFLSQISFNPCWDFGINFKARFLIDARNRVSNDPDFDSTTMLIKSRMHYRLELPLTYRYSSCLYLRLVPYYERRQYGKQANFPFDFIETKVNIGGAILKFIFNL